MILKSAAAMLQCCPTIVSFTVHENEVIVHEQQDTYGLMPSTNQKTAVKAAWFPWLCAVNFNRGEINYKYLCFASRANRGSLPRQYPIKMTAVKANTSHDILLQASIAQELQILSDMLLFVAVPTKIRLFGLYPIDCMFIWPHPSFFYSWTDVVFI